jgi:hypothetical protein
VHPRSWLAESAPNATDAPAIAIYGILEICSIYKTIEACGDVVSRVVHRRSAVEDLPVITTADARMDFGKPLSRERRARVSRVERAAGVRRA